MTTEAFLFVGGPRHGQHFAVEDTKIPRIIVRCYTPIPPLPGGNTNMAVIGVEDVAYTKQKSSHWTYYLYDGHARG